MKKTINKWDITTPRQEKIGRILKISAAVVFLAIWSPAFVYTISQVPDVLLQVIKLIIK